MPRRLNLLRVPRRNQWVRNLSSSSVILTEETKKCLRNLAAYTPPPPEPGLVYPLSRSAAVLVALFIGRTGDLYVILSRRSNTLRSFPGDTSLPGGRYEQGDRSLEDTARREAYEEIGLPRDKKKIPLLCYLEPFLAGTHLLVTPVVVLILDPDVQPVLNEPEVSELFSHPLRSFLSLSPPFYIRHTPHKPLPSPQNNSKQPKNQAHLPLTSVSADEPHASESSIPDLPSEESPNASSSSSKTSPPESPQTRADPSAALGWKRHLSIPKAPTGDVIPATSPQQPPSDDGRNEYYSYRDINWGQGTVRMHRFLTGREEKGIKPVYGLTAAILLHTAMIGYDLSPEFPRRSEGQKPMRERIAHALRTVPVLVEAVKEEQARRKSAKGKVGGSRTRSRL